jgi:hypothetical protein
VTGGFNAAGSSGDACPSDAPLGSISAAVEPALENRPRYGAGMPLKASHGVAVLRVWSERVACFALTGVLELPPSS